MSILIPYHTRCLKLLFISKLLFLSGVLFAQTSNVYFGLNISDNIVNQFMGRYRSAKGLALEPLLYNNLSNKYVLRSSIGYDWYKATGIRNDDQKMMYNCRGAFVKVALLRKFSKMNEEPGNAFGLEITNSGYREFGYYEIIGAYFGNYIVEFDNHFRNTFSISPVLDFIIASQGKMRFSTHIYFPFLIAENTNDLHGRFYVPGLGVRSKNTDKQFQRMGIKIDYCLIFRL